MRFLIHGNVNPDAQQAMLKHEQALHTMLELSEESASVTGFEDSPAELLKVLAKKQWNLLTTDTAFVHQMYEQKVEFAGVIVLLLDDPAVLHDQGPAVDRLFERYKRLTPRRLYTITASRVKIRQLPGAAQAG
jgi:hypothetical protein